MVHMVLVLCLAQLDVLWMNVVREMTGVNGVCEMCMCLAWGGVGGAEVSG